MSHIDTTYLKRCITTLQNAYSLLQKTDEKSTDYDMYRSAIIKEFEIILEQSGKLLKKCLIPYFHSKKAVDQLVFKDIFRQAAAHGLISLDEAERWLVYRDNRNSTAHDYGQQFADDTLELMTQFILDATAVTTTIAKHPHA